MWLTSSTNASRPTSTSSPATAHACASTWTAGPGLGLAFAALCKSAQRGEPMPAGPALAIMVATILPYLRQTSPGELDPTDPPSLVILAALARKKLEDGRPLEADDLATLAGMTSKAVRLLARQGKLQLDQDEQGLLVCHPAEARRWLRSRDVLGA